MSPQRIMSLAITASALALSTAFAASGTSERVHGIVTPATAVPATAYTFLVKPPVTVAVTSNSMPEV